MSMWSTKVKCSVCKKRVPAILKGRNKGKPMPHTVKMESSSRFESCRGSATPS